MQNDNYSSSIHNGRNSTSLSRITITTTSTKLSMESNNKTIIKKNETIVSEDDGSESISLLRTKRFLQRMPKIPKLLHNRTKIESSSSSSSSSLDDDHHHGRPKFGTKNISLVLASLLDHYDHNQRPGYGGSPAVITTNLEIRSMGPISELDMEYSLDCYFRQKWQDERLRFTGNANFLSLNIKMLDKIWKPDTYFHTGKASHLHMITTPNKFLRIFKNGLVLYSMRLTIKSLCPMDLHSFPMDKQSCPLILGSYGFPADQLVYSWDSKPVTFNQKDFTLSQFDIVKTIYRNGTFAFKRGNHSMLQVNFNLRRHVGYFLIQIYVPCSLIVVLSWVSFWINREATSDRVGLGVTAVLTLSTFGLDSRSDLPRVSYATALDWYTVMCFLFVVFTLLEFAGVHYFTKVGTGEMPVIEIDDDWTKSSDSEEQQSQHLQQQSPGIDSISTKLKQHTQLRHRRRRRQRIPNTTTSTTATTSVVRNKSRNKSTSRMFKQRKKIQPLMNQKYHQRETLSSIQPMSIHKFNNNQLLDYHESTLDNSSIIHMPHCPRYRYSQQQLRRPIDQDDNVDDVVDQEWVKNGYNNHNYRQHQAWKLNSSWPTLSWENNFNKIKNQQFYQPTDVLEQHYSIDHLTRIQNYGMDSDMESNLMKNLEEEQEAMFYNKDDNDISSNLEDDDDDQNDDEGSNSDNSIGINFWLWRRIFAPLSQCCLEFWYCFTANEQFKKEMKRRRTKGQGMCAVNSVSMIDKVSRILFPLVFFILNMSYWTFYINERNADFQQWES